LGIAACIGSAVAGVAFFALVVIAGVLEESTPGGIPEDDPLLATLGLAMMGLMLLDVVALGLGIGGLLQPDRNRALPIVGIVLSAVVLLMGVGLIALGMMME
jgi:hypothetical protein